MKYHISQAVYQSPAVKLAIMTIYSTFISHDESQHQKHLARVLTPCSSDPRNMASRAAHRTALHRTALKSQVKSSVPNRPVRTPGPWRPIVPSVPGRVGTDGQARRLSFVNTAGL